MKFLFTCIIVWNMFSVLVTCQQKTPDELYTDLSNIEYSFPFPELTATIDVRTFMPNNPISERSRGIVNDNYLQAFTKCVPAMRNLILFDS